MLIRKLCDMSYCSVCFSASKQVQMDAKLYVSRTTVLQDILSARNFFIQKSGWDFFRFLIASYLISPRSARAAGWEIDHCCATFVQLVVCVV